MESATFPVWVWYWKCKHLLCSCVLQTCAAWGKMKEAADSTSWSGITTRCKMSAFSSGMAGVMATETASKPKQTARVVVWGHVNRTEGNPLRTYVMELSQIPLQVVQYHVCIVLLVAVTVVVSYFLGPWDLGLHKFQWQVKVLPQQTTKEHTSTQTKCWMSNSKSPFTISQLAQRQKSW